MVGGIRRDGGRVGGLEAGLWSRVEVTVGSNDNLLAQPAMGIKFLNGSNRLSVPSFACGLWFPIGPSAAAAFCVAAGDDAADVQPFVWNCILLYCSFCCCSSYLQRIYPIRFQFLLDFILALPCDFRLCCCCRTCCCSGDFVLSGCCCALCCNCYCSHRIPDSNCCC